MNRSCFARRGSEPEETVEASRTRSLQVLWITESGGERDGKTLRWSPGWRPGERTVGQGGGSGRVYEGRVGQTTQQTGFTSLSKGYSVVFGGVPCLSGWGLGIVAGCRLSGFVILLLKPQTSYLYICLCTD